MKFISIALAKGSLVFLIILLRIALLLLIFITVSEAQPSPMISTKPTNGPRLSTGVHDRPLRDRHPSFPVSSAPISSVAVTNTTSAPFTATPQHAPNAHRAPRPNQRGPTNSPLLPCFQCDKLSFVFSPCYYTGPALMPVITATVKNSNSCLETIPVVTFSFKAGSPIPLIGGGTVEVILSTICAGMVLYQIKDTSGNTICPNGEHIVA